jgi:hypothetical protein
VLLGEPCDGHAGSSSHEIMKSGVRDMTAESTILERGWKSEGSRYYPRDTEAGDVGCKPRLEEELLTFDGEGST